MSEILDKIKSKLNEGVVEEATKSGEIVKFIRKEAGISELLWILEGAEFRLKTLTDKISDKPLVKKLNAQSNALNKFNSKFEKFADDNGDALEPIA